VRPRQSGPLRRPLSSGLRFVAAELRQCAGKAGEVHPIVPAGDVDRQRTGAELRDQRRRLRAGRVDLGPGRAGDLHLERSKHFVRLLEGHVTTARVGRRLMFVHQQDDVLGTATDEGEAECMRRICRLACGTDLGAVWMNAQFGQPSVIGFRVGRVHLQLRRQADKVRKPQRGKSIRKSVSDGWPRVLSVPPLLAASMLK
jgi:hypothetical protein